MIIMNNNNINNNNNNNYVFTNVQLQFYQAINWKSDDFVKSDLLNRIYIRDFSVHQTKEKK